MSEKNISKIRYSVGVYMQNYSVFAVKSLHKDVDVIVNLYVRNMIY